MGELMKAAVISRYGSPDVIAVRHVAKPIPAANEILVRVHAASVNRTDSGELRAQPFFIRVFTGLLRPRRSILGMEFAGEIEAVGSEIVSFAPGERVFGICPSRKNGAQAQYVCVAEGSIETLPEGIRFDEAVVCEGAFYANGILQQIGVKRGDDILVYGGSGAIGAALVQLAKAAGAKVTAVVATRHLDLAKSLGADRTIDYTAEDFTRLGETFDFIIDAVGKTSFRTCRKLLKPRGTFASSDLGPGGENAWLTIWSSITRSRRVVMAAPRRIDGFVSFLKDRMEAGEFRAVVDRHFDLEAIADAYRYVETGQKVGVVVIDVAATAEEARHAGAA